MLPRGESLLGGRRLPGSPATAGDVHFFAGTLLRGSAHSRRPASRRENVSLGRNKAGAFFPALRRALAGPSLSRLSSGGVRWSKAYEASLELNFGPFAAARIGAPVVLTAQGHCDRRALLSDKAITANLPPRFFSHSPSAKYPQLRSATLVYITNIPAPPRNHTSAEMEAARLSQCLRQPPGCQGHVKELSSDFTIEALSALVSISRTNEPSILMLSGESCRK